MAFTDELPPDLFRTRGPCTNITGIKLPDYRDDSFREVPLLAYEIDDDTKGLVIHWVQQHDVSPWTPAELIKHEYELETQQGIGSVPWIRYADGAVDRRCELAVVNAFRSAPESRGRASSGGRRHDFYPGCAGWAEIMHNNRLISWAGRAADRRVLAVEVEGRQLNDSDRIRLHQVCVVFESLDSPFSEDEEDPARGDEEGRASEDDGGTVSGDDGGAVFDDDSPVSESDGDEASV